MELRAARVISEFVFLVAFFFLSAPVVAVALLWSRVERASALSVSSCGRCRCSARLSLSDLLVARSRQAGGSDATSQTISHAARPAFSALKVAVAFRASHCWLPACALRCASHSDPHSRSRGAVRDQRTEPDGFDSIRLRSAIRRCQSELARQSHGGSARCSTSPQTAAASRHKPITIRPTAALQWRRRSAQTTSASMDRVR